MNYRHIAIAFVIFLITQITVWFQINGTIIWPQYKSWKPLLLILGIPVSWMFIEATQYAVTGFAGLFWPSRFLSFVTGIMVFAALTYFIRDEVITTKTAVSLLLCVAIILIQLFWK
jgi:hypothetical protein